MDIDDLLLDPQFKVLDSFLTKEMHRLSDEHLMEDMRDVFSEDAYARNWFYSSLQTLDGKRPYDLCKEGNIEEVRVVLGRIKHGVY